MVVSAVCYANLSVNSYQLRVGSVKSDVSLTENGKRKTKLNSELTSALSTLAQRGTRRAYQLQKT